MILKIVTFGGVTMRIGGYDKLSTVDYPGEMACAIFLVGCNFNCGYCHNPSLISGDGNYIPKEEVMDYLKLRKDMLDAVCISGGEPTCNPDLKDFIKEIKALGYKVKLDTNGTNPKMLKELVESGLVDYVAMDVKGSLMKYKEIAGAPHLDLDNIQKSIDLLKSDVVDYEFRTTIVDEFHNEVDMMSMGRLLKGAKRLYLQKFQISDGVINKNLHPVDEDSINKFVDILKEYIDEVDTRGY